MPIPQNDHCNLAQEKHKASEARRMEREKKQTEKKRQDEMKKALKKAASDAGKEIRDPAERVKQMIVVLEKALVENVEFMTDLTKELSTLSVAYEVGLSDMHPGSVQWKRRLSERTVDENAKVSWNNKVTTQLYFNYCQISLHVGIWICAYFAIFKRYAVGMEHNAEIEI